ncbi:MAG TPA: hypothetical protein DCX60_07560 [Phycisphaerales bacterium]|nr:hypothetical protein [Phycisphaerales bacterium]
MDEPSISDDTDPIADLLGRLDALPSPTALAMRLMHVLDDDQSTAREIIDLIATDPALSARVVGLCARSERGRSLGVTSLDRAVVLLGFDAVKTAAFSVRFFQAVNEIETSKSSGFDLSLFWRHSLAVAVLSEKIASDRPGVSESSAFIGGLVHDIGHLALHSLVPKIFGSACEIADMRTQTVDVIVQNNLGIDGRTAGRRVARQWGLPEELIDVVWLLDQPMSVIGGCVQPELVAIVSLADAIVAGDHLCIKGHGTRASALRDICNTFDLDLNRILDMRADVLVEVERKAEELGLDSAPTTELLLESIARANRSVGRFARAYRDRLVESRASESSLDSLRRFLNRLPCESVEDAVQLISDSARDHIPNSSACVILPPDDASEDPRIWLFEGGSVNKITFEAGMPADVARDVLSRNRLERCGHPIRLSLRGERVAIVALGVEVGTLSSDFNPDSALKSAWKAAIDHVLMREHAEYISEKLAHSNRVLVDHRETLSKARAASAVAAIAAGAAHEINTPLALIAGRSHLLSKWLANTEFSGAASEIEDASMRATEIIDALSESVRPIEIMVRPTSIGRLLADACNDVSDHRGERVSIRSNGPLPTALVDPDHLRCVLVEIIENGLRASNDGPIVLEAESIEGDLHLVIRDHGSGFTEKAMHNAFEPFFSDQPAGRRRGLGLSMARRLIEAHGGSISLSNHSSGKSGARVSIHLPEAVVSNPAAGKTFITTS